MKNVVIYFSVTERTKKVAQRLSSYLKCDLFEIIPTISYSEDDLDWQNERSRVSKEDKDKSIRPKILKKIDIEKYDTIYLGFPIWWYDAPNIIYTFLDTNNFTGKVIIPFGTSCSSTMSLIPSYLKEHAKTEVKEGFIFQENPTLKDLKEFLVNNK